MKPTAVYPSVPISSDRAEINSYLETLLSIHSQASGGTVFDAMRYAVLGSAQRIRPILSLRIARLVGAPLELTLAAAGSVELLHCASLIIDDLPCMDDSAFRRNRAAVHMRFGEATAILAAFALVALAARSLLEQESPQSDRVIPFQLSLLRTLDCCGLIAGQALDLENSSRERNHSSSHISDLKTVPLFTLAVQAGSLTQIPNADSRAVLSGFGREFGLAFQMSDDLLDGEEQDQQPFREKLSLLRALVAHFGSAAQDLESLIDYLNDRVAVQKSCQ